MGLIHRLMGGRAGLILGAVLLLLASPLLAPQLLAFPYKQQTAIGTIWSEEPLSTEMIAQTVHDTQVLLTRTPLATASESRPIFITNGGWRWQWVANRSADAFAITRPFSSAVVVNRTDERTGLVDNGRPVGGERALSQVLAHEFTHGLIYRNYGIARAIRFPDWKVEGYADHVAGRSTLDAEEVERLEAEGSDHPAISYFQSRQRVERILRANGGSPDALFE